MKGEWIGGVALAALIVICGLAQPAHAGTKCEMTFSLEGWSAFYASSSGHATITCENGQSAKATIRAKGGGLTVGKTDIINGRGSFTDVADISQVFGKYASMQTEAGAGHAAEALVMAKGNVQLALSGTGKGVDLGISWGEFVIERASAKGKKKSK